MSAVRNPFPMRKISDECQSKNISDGNFLSDAVSIGMAYFP